MSTRINSVPDALMSALIAVDIDTTWRFLTEHLAVVMDTTAIRKNVFVFFGLLRRPIDSASSSLVASMRFVLLVATLLSSLIVGALATECTSGCSDEYHSNYDCQWIDITNVTDGHYWLTVSSGK